MGYFPEGQMGQAKRTAAQRSKELQEAERVRSAAFDARAEREAAQGSRRSTHGERRVENHEVLSELSNGRAVQQAATVGGMSSVSRPHLPSDEILRRARIASKGMGAVGAGLQAGAEGSRVSSEVRRGKPADEAVAGSVGRMTATTGASVVVGGSIGGVPGLVAGPLIGAVADWTGVDELMGRAAERGVRGGKAFGRQVGRTIGQGLRSIEGHYRPYPGKERW